MSCQIYYYVSQGVDVQNLVGIDSAVTDLRMHEKRRFSSVDFGVKVAHYKQHVPLEDLFDCLRQVLVEPLHFFVRSCCRWSILIQVYGPTSTSLVSCFSTHGVVTVNCNSSICS